VTPAAVWRIDVEHLPDRLTVPPTAGGRSYRGVLGILFAGGRPVGRMWMAVRDGVAIPDPVAVARAEQAAALEGPPPRVPRPGPQPAVTVVVTTCRRDDLVVRCLQALLGGAWRNLEVIVVENRPGGSPVPGGLWRTFAEDDRVVYVEEAGAGLSRARNRGLRAASSGIVLFLDDDLIPDGGWVQAMAAPLLADEGLVAVAGNILPLVLQRPEQLAQEQFASYGRGFARRRIDPRDALGRDPVAVPGAIGPGGCIGARADVLREMGGFDVTLGAGTPTLGGEELDLFMRVLEAGYAIQYEPSAVAWHEHPADRRNLRRRAFQTGVGRSAAVARRIARTVPDAADRRGARAWLGLGLRQAVRHRPRALALPSAPGYPGHLDWIERAGIAAGPLAYLRSAAAERGRPEA
jgi:GT2 family glycosyltransferase